MSEKDQNSGEKELNQLVGDIDKVHNGIYAHPHESKEGRKKTVRLMRELIDNHKKGNRCKKEPFL